MIETRKMISGGSGYTVSANHMVELGTFVLVSVTKWEGGNFFRENILFIF